MTRHEGPLILSEAPSKATGGVEGRRSLLAKIIVGVSLAFLALVVPALVLLSLLYRHLLIEERRARLDLVAALMVERGLAHAGGPEDLVGAIEGGAITLRDELGEASVVLVDDQGLALSIDGGSAEEPARAAARLLATVGSLDSLTRSASRPEGDRLIHLTPIRSQEGVLEGALILDAPLRSIDARVASHMLLVMGGVIALLVLLGVVVIRVLYRHILRPLGAITTANRALVLGETDAAMVREAAIPADELGDVIRARNQIYERMLEYQGAIREQNQTLERQGRELKRWARELERRVRAKSEELEATHDRLLASEKAAATGRLAAGLAHEINNPLASIAGYAEELQELAKDDDLAQLAAFAEFPASLRTIEEQAYRCTQIIQRLMTFARPGPYVPNAIDLTPLVEGVLPLVEHKARGRDVAVIMDLDPDVPRVLASRSDLEQVLVNLLVNAFDGIDGPTGQITVVTRRASPVEIAIDVRDTGPGISDEIRRRIFDPFFTTKPVGKGTGLGLSICHALVERMRGRIEVSSIPGQGATFTVVLPIAPDDARVDEVAASVGASRSEETAPG